MFSELFTTSIFRDLESQFNRVNSSSILEILTKPKLSIEDFMVLIAPGAAPFLEQMAAKSRQITLSRFGNNIVLYAPLYVSNECVNTCSYCGFSRPNQIRRRTLTLTEVEREAQALRSSGIKNVLLLTGEHPKKNPIAYLLECVKIIRRYFDSIQIEIYPLEVHEYRAFFEAGVEGVTVYQEVYQPQYYSKYHLGGPKQDFAYRLDTPDRIANAGLRHITIGALLGMAPWRLEMAALGMHLQYLEHKAQRSSISVSFPRIRDAAFALPAQFQVTDRDLVQIITAFRLFSPNVGINVSTRESIKFRNGIMKIGATHMSCGSRTDIGGYSGDSNSTEQFAIDDIRQVGEFCDYIRSSGYNPVFKEFDMAVQGVSDSSALNSYSQPRALV